jgi:hypothetical protein
MTDSTLIVYRLHRHIKANERKRRTGRYTDQEADKWNEYNFAQAGLLWDKYRYGSKNELVVQLLSRIVLKALIKEETNA